MPLKFAFLSLHRYAVVGAATALALGTLTATLTVAKPPAGSAPRSAPPAAPVATFANPISDRNQPDPGVLFDGSTYYMTHTMRGPDQGWPLYRSPDLVHWTFDKHLLTPDNKPAWMKDAFWAPEIHRTGEGKSRRYVLTFTSMNRDTGKLCVGLAVASAPGGPYTVQPTPLVSEPVSVLDSHIYQDTDGKAYFLWKRDSAIPQPVGGQGVGGAIYAQEMNRDLTGFAPGSAPVKVLEGDPENTAPESVWEKGLVEAPWIVKRDGYYYLFYSGAYIDTSYALGVARSRSPLGPYTRCPGNPILRSNARWGGPGHGSLLTDAKGDWWHLYHARHQERPKDGRVQLLDRVYWLGDWPAFGLGGTPSWEAQPAPPTPKTQPTRP